jgi:hypothetical protein
MAAKIKKPQVITVRLTPSEAIALYETVKTMSITLPNQTVMMAAYKKLEVAAADARSGE